MANYYESAVKIVVEPSTGFNEAVPDIPETISIISSKLNASQDKIVFMTPDTATATPITKATFNERQPGGAW